MATTDDAVIRLRLDTSQAKADLRDFEGSARGITVGARAGAQGGSNSPGGGGGGLMGMMRGMGAGVGGMAALAGMFLAPGALMGLDGTNGYVGGAGRNAAEWMGLGAFSRNSHNREKAEDKTVSQLGAAGLLASDSQIRGLYDLNKQLTTMSTDAENRVRSIVGKEETTDTAIKMLEIMTKIYDRMGGEGISISSTPTSGAGGIGSSQGLRGK